MNLNIYDDNLLVNKKMRLWVQISPGSNEPIYLQIAAQISEAIAKGELAAGDQLPTVRKLAGELVINPNTVARAYNVLEGQGLIVSKIGAGTFVTDPRHRDKDASRLHILAERMDNVIIQALNLGLNQQTITELFHTRLTNLVSYTDSGKQKNE